MQYPTVKQILEGDDLDALNEMAVFQVGGQQYVSFVFRLNPRKVYNLAKGEQPDSVFLTDGVNPRRLYVTYDPALHPAAPVVAAVEQGLDETVPPPAEPETAEEVAAEDETTADQQSDSEKLIASLTKSA